MELYFLIRSSTGVKDYCFSKNTFNLQLKLWKANSKFIPVKREEKTHDTIFHQARYVCALFQVPPGDFLLDSDAKRRMAKSLSNTTFESFGFPEHDSVIVDATVQI